MQGVQQEDHPARQLQHDPAVDVRGGDLEIAGDGDAVRHHAGAAGGRREHHAASRGRAQVQGLAADVGVGQGLAGGGVRPRELRLVASEPGLHSERELAQERALSHPAEVRVVQEGERRDRDRAGSLPLDPRQPACPRQPDGRAVGWVIGHSRPF